MTSNLTAQETLRHARKFCLAPMMNRTDKHMRYFFRLISKHAMLYTEMLHAGAVAFGNWRYLLDYDPAEKPLACQLGGSDPLVLAKAAKIVASAGFVEVNLNVGCPSQRVQDGAFGACLMRNPPLVAECLLALRDSTDIAVSIKCRIGIDEFDYQSLRDFVGEVHRLSGVEIFIVHARIAKLSGFSPRQNRQIPPLQYDVVRRLKGDFSDLEIIVNGGIRNMSEALRHVEIGDGVMVGRAAVDTPLAFANVDRYFFGDVRESLSAEAIFGEYIRYCQPHWQRAGQTGESRFALLRPLFGLFHGQRQARMWRRELADIACKSGSGSDLGLDSLYALHKNYTLNVAMQKNLLQKQSTKELV